MRTDEVIVDQDPVQMPGSTGQGCHELAEREVEALDEGGLDLAAEAEGQERALPLSARATANAGVERLGSLGRTRLMIRWSMGRTWLINA